jgi:hypothetical protein
MVIGCCIILRQVLSAFLWPHHLLSRQRCETSGSPRRGLAPRLDPASRSCRCFSDPPRFPGRQPCGTSSTPACNLARRPTPTCRRIRRCSELHYSPEQRPSGTSAWPRRGFAFLQSHAPCDTLRQLDINTTGGSFYEVNEPLYVAIIDLQLHDLTAANEVINTTMHDSDKPADNAILR